MNRAVDMNLKELRETLLDKRIQKKKETVLREQNKKKKTSPLFTELSLFIAAC